MFAAILIIIGGSFGILQGVALIAKSAITSSQPTTGSGRPPQPGDGVYLIAGLIVLVRVLECFPVLPGRAGSASSW